MNREDIIRMAREAGFHVMTDPLFGDAWLAQHHEDAFHKFAALVAAATAEEYEQRLRFTQERWEIECKSQVEIEREACAKTVEAIPLFAVGEMREFERATLEDAAKQIRARGQA